MLVSLTPLLGRIRKRLYQVRAGTSGIVDPRTHCMMHDGRNGDRLSVIKCESAVSLFAIHPSVFRFFRKDQWNAAVQGCNGCALWGRGKIHIYQDKRGRTRSKRSRKIFDFANEALF